MFDYETRKMLEEAWLCEMAVTRQRGKLICQQHAFQFITHLAKCFLFYNTQWYNHWLKECANFCVECDNISLKPDAKRPEMQFFMEDDCICEEIETADDAKIYLNSAISRCPEIERENATNDEALRFLDMWEDLRIELADYMADKDTFDRSEYIEIIDKAIKRNI